MLTLRNVGSQYQQGHCGKSLLGSTVVCAVLYRIALHMLCARRSTPFPMRRHSFARDIPVRNVQASRFQRQLAADGRTIVEALWGLCLPEKGLPSMNKDIRELAEDALTASYTQVQYPFALVQMHHLEA